MNNTQRLQDWTAQWRARKLLSELPLETPEPPVLSESQLTHAAPFTVSAGADLAERLLAQLHDAVTPDDAQKASLSGSFIVSAAGTSIPRVPIVRGQIRQLNPELKPTWTRSLFVLILTVDAQSGMALAAPFSEFDQPAFEGELSTGLSDPSLAVLCVWNATWVPCPTLSRSWWLTDAFDDLLDAADILYQARSARQPVPESLKDRVGPPLLHPLDPRHDYLDHEAGLLEDFEPDTALE